jgi:hypothetical protein
MKHIEQRKERPAKQPNQAELLVSQIDAAILAFRKLPRQKQGDMYVDLQCAERITRRKGTKVILLEILDVMHVELYGYSNRHDYQTTKFKKENPDFRKAKNIVNENQQFDVLDAEYINDYEH